MKKVITSMFVLAILAGCQPSPSPHEAKGEVTLPPPSREGLSGPPALELLKRSPELTVVSQVRTSTRSKGLDMRLDATTPETFLRSLQATEQHLTPTELDELRASLVIAQMLMSRKVAALASMNPNNVQFSDDDLFRLTYHDYDGMTMAEVIAYGRKMAPTVVGTAVGMPSKPTLPAGFP